MFTRITRYKLKPGAHDAAVAQMETMRSSIMALPGLHEFINAVDADGNGYVISLVESRESSDANADAVRALWGRMAEHLVEIPVAEGFDVVAHWQT